MIYTISNEYISAGIESNGAELRSLLSAGGNEYIWQRDRRYWEDSAPFLFPYIGRLYDGSYIYRGNRYNMGIHGFAAKSRFEIGSVCEDSVTMLLTENEDTLAQYPFRFELAVSFTLSGASLSVRSAVTNRDSKPMPFALGGHPGINVPMYKGTEFEDCYLSFGESCEPSRIGFTDEVLVSDEQSPYPLENGKTLNLRHDLFCNDAIILSHTAKRVTLGCKNAAGTLTMDFPDFDYFGIWHMPHTDAPYVCLEPWTSLPSRQGVVEDIALKDDMLTLAPGETRDFVWTLTVSEA